MKKADVQRSYHQHSSGLPMVNVKVHARFDALPVPHEEIPDDELAEFTAYLNKWWADERNNHDSDHLFYAACENQWDALQQDATNTVWPDRKVEVYAEGRSGGWAVVSGLPDVDDWDAVMVSKWARFAGWAREYADSIPREMSLILYDRWSAAREAAAIEAERVAEAARLEIATVNA